MKDQETNKVPPDTRIANKARTWRHAEKRAIGEKTADARKAEHHALQKLREAVDTLGGR